MEKAVDNLEALFQKAEVDLNYLSRKLQMDNGQALNEEDNPIRLMAQVEEIKAEYSALASDITAIQAAQKETVSFFQSSLLKMTELLSKLETQSEDTENAEMAQALYGQLSELMGVSTLTVLPQPVPTTGDQHLVTHGESSGAKEQASSSSSSEPCLNVGKSKEKEPVSALERRSQCLDFVDLTNEEFMSVSKLVRGKVKLDDLNRTYKMLWQHFKEAGNKEALSPQQMNSMGLRVSGATGEAKLKVLRALKLCQISKNGDVKLS